MKYKKDFLAYFEKFPLFTFNDAKLFLSKKGASYDYSRKMISLMLKRGELYRITKGHYTLERNLTIAGYAFKPFYYGLGYVLTHYGLSEQGYNLEIITTKKVREGVRVIFGLNVVVFRIPQGLFFGYRDVPDETFHYYMSDIEKTLLDLIYFDQVVEDYVYKNIFREINRDRIANYLGHYDKSISEKYRELEKRFGASPQ